MFDQPYPPGRDPVASWEPVTQYETGVRIPESETVEYEVQCSSGGRLYISVTTDTRQRLPLWRGEWECAIRARVLVLWSDWSNSTCVRVPGPPFDCVSQWVN